MKTAKSAQKRSFSPLLAGIEKVPRAGIEPAWPCGRGILSPVGRSQNHEVTSYPDSILTKTDGKTRSISRFPRKRRSAFLFGARRGKCF